MMRMWGVRHIRYWLTLYRLKRRIVERSDLNWGPPSLTRAERAYLDKIWRGTNDRLFGA
jgi:hypothetical protein